MFYRVPVIAILAMLTALCGCRVGRMAPPADPTTAEARAMADANTRFGFNLFEKLRGEKPEQNLFISPLSASMALAMTANGAAGETRQEMLAALQWQGMDMAQVNAALKELRSALQSADPQVTLAIADSLWADRGVEFKPDFLNIQRSFFDARVESLEFDDPKSADIINGWVKEQTKGLIPDITTPAELSNLWVTLLDAVYFKGKWSEPFKKSNTEDATFTLLKGQKTVPMMRQSGDYRYLQTEALQAISLPYGSKRMEMIVLLPAKDSSIGALCKGLSVEKLDEWLGGMHSQEGTIKLPRFQAKETRELNDALVALGMGRAFDRDQADFSAMSDAEMWIEFVKQKSFLKVDEEGTEAAAVTQVGMVGRAAPPPREPFEMVVNRPFFLAIRDRESGTILFMGAIVDPEVE